MTHSTTARKALFLDRDGIINVNHGYVSRQEDIDFIDSIFTLATKAKEAGYIIIIVTNQSGIAREYYSEQDFHKLSRWLENQFWQHGIKISKTLHCPHHPNYSYSCTCRKPRIGMITKASKQFNIDLRQSIMIGDSLSDMRCAQQAKIKTRVYLNPKLSHFKGKLVKPNYKPYFEARTLKSILPLIR